MKYSKQGLFLYYTKTSKIIGMTQEEQGNHSMMEQFQSAYAAMLAELERVDNQRRNIMVQRESEVGMISMELRQKTNYYEALLNDKGKRIGELEDMVRRLQSDENEKNRKEMRRYMESSNEKEAENNALKRQVNSLKIKINSLQSELSSCNNSKEDMELFIVKSFEQLKITNKEISNSIEQNETDAMVMDSKFKQTSEKTNMLTEKITELEIQLKSSEESYGKMKALFKSSKDECLNLKFQLQELKEKSRSHRHNDGQITKDNEGEGYLLNEIEGIIELKNVLRERESFLKQVSDYHDMNSSLLHENDQLKTRIKEMENQLHEFKSKYVSGYQDELLKKADPPLFEYLEGKKANFMHFEQIIEKIESYIEEKDDHINKILTGFSEKNLQCVCGKEAEVARLQAQCSRLQSDLSRNQQESSKHSSDSSMIQAQLSRYQSEASRLENQLAKLQAEYSKNKIDAGKLKTKEAELAAAASKSEAQQETIQKLRKDVLGYEKTVSQYKVEMKEILTLDPRAKKKKTQKKRCFGCFFNIERNESTENCAECKRTYHSTCIDDHKCEVYKFDDGMSYISGTNEL